MTARVRHHQAAPPMDGCSAESGNGAWFGHMTAELRSTCSWSGFFCPDSDDIAASQSVAVAASFAGHCRATASRRLSSVISASSSRPFSFSRNADSSPSDAAASFHPRRSVLRGVTTLLCQGPEARTSCPTRSGVQATSRWYSQAEQSSRQTSWPALCNWRHAVETSGIE